MKWLVGLLGRLPGKSARAVDGAATGRRGAAIGGVLETTALFQREPSPSPLAGTVFRGKFFGESSEGEPRQGPTAASADASGGESRLIGAELSSEIYRRNFEMATVHLAVANEELERLWRLEAAAERIARRYRNEGLVEERDIVDLASRVDDIAAWRKG